MWGNFREKLKDRGGPALRRAWRERKIHTKIPERAQKNNFIGREEKKSQTLPSRS